MKFVTWSTKKIFVRSLNSIKSSRKNIWKEFKRLQRSYDLEIRRIIQQLAFVWVISVLWWASLWASELYVQSLGYVLWFRRLNALLLFEHETHPLAPKCFCCITPEGHCASEARKIQAAFKLLSRFEISNWLWGFFVLLTLLNVFCDTDWVSKHFSAKWGSSLIFNAQKNEVVSWVPHQGILLWDSWSTCWIAPVSGCLGVQAGFKFKLLDSEYVKYVLQFSSNK